ncbi:uncharacterized protein LOC121371235 [Gigantopelta aegis]|uniref:uncharacterized protein LOC121371235 n=1 Tax=Gigantopelta aegis TaxID=1735272 RepID=UPI001B88E6C7|nr:uncharacterized protein LOC121371235 [Gigantopelta aegis]
MSLKESFVGVSSVKKIAFVILLFAQMSNWIAFTTADWGRQSNSFEWNNLFTGIGLWRSCSNGADTAVVPCQMLDGTRNDLYASIQAFATFGFVGINLAFFILLLQIFFDKCKSVSDTVNGVICFLATGCYLIAVIQFGVYFDTSFINKRFGFSFSFAIVAFILSMIAGILFIKDNIKLDKKKPQT